MGVLMKSGSGLQRRWTAESGVAVEADDISEGNVTEKGVESFSSFSLTAGMVTTTTTTTTGCRWRRQEACRGKRARRRGRGAPMLVGGRQQRARHKTAAEAGYIAMGRRGEARECARVCERVCETGPHGGVAAAISRRPQT